MRREKPSIFQDPLSNEDLGKGELGISLSPTFPPFLLTDVAIYFSPLHTNKIIQSSLDLHGAKERPSSVQKLANQRGGGKLPCTMDSWNEKAMVRSMSSKKRDAT